MFILLEIDCPYKLIQSSHWKFSLQSIVTSATFESLCSKQKTLIQFICILLSMYDSHVVMLSLITQRHKYSLAIAWFAESLL